MVFYNYCVIICLIILWDVILLMDISNDIKKLISDEKKQLNNKKSKSKCDHIKTAQRKIFLYYCQQINNVDSEDLINRNKDINKKLNADNILLLPLLTSLISGLLVYLFTELSKNTDSKISIDSPFYMKVAFIIIVALILFIFWYMLDFLKKTYIKSQSNDINTLLKFEKRIITEIMRSHFKVYIE